MRNEGAAFVWKSAKLETDESANEEARNFNFRSGNDVKERETEN